MILRSSSCVGRRLLRSLCLALKFAESFVGVHLWMNGSLRGCAVFLCGTSIAAFIFLVTVALTWRLSATRRGSAVLVAACVIFGFCVCFIARSTGGSYF